MMAQGFVRLGNQLRKNKKCTFCEKNYCNSKFSPYCRGLIPFNLVAMFYKRGVSLESR